MNNNYVIMCKKRTLHGVYNSLAKPCLQEEKLPESAGTLYCTVGKPAQACINDESTVCTANPGNEVL